MNYLKLISNIKKMIEASVDVKVFYETVSEKNEDDHVIQFNIINFENTTPRDKYYINIIISVWSEKGDDIIKLEQLADDVFNTFNFKRKAGDGCLFYTTNVRKGNVSDSNSAVQSGDKGQTKRRTIIFEGFVWF